VVTWEAHRAASTKRRARACRSCSVKPPQRSPRVRCRPHARAADFGARNGRTDGCPNRAGSPHLSALETPAPARGDSARKKKRSCPRARRQRRNCEGGREPSSTRGGAPPPDRLASTQLVLWPGRPGAARVMRTGTVRDQYRALGIPRAAAARRLFNCGYHTRSGARRTGCERPNTTSCIQL